MKGMGGIYDTFRVVYKADRDRTDKTFMYKPINIGEGVIENSNIERGQVVEKLKLSKKPIDVKKTKKIADRRPKRTKPYKRPSNPEMRSEVCEKSVDDDVKRVTKIKDRF